MRKKPLILIIDDDPTFRESFSDILDIKGYTPITAATEKEVFKKLKKESPSVALIDLKLGETSGLDVMSQIKQSHPSMECIVITGHGSQTSAIEAVNLGAYGYVLKPCDVEQLMVFIRRAIEKQEAEKALRESEDRLRSLFETMTEGVILISSDGQIHQANPAAERILGLKYSEIEGRNYVGPEWEIIRPDGTPMPPEEMAGPRAMKEKRPVKNVVMGYKHPDNSITWINGSAAPLINSAGELEGAVGTFADITERKQAEEEIRKFKTISDRASYGVVMSDIGGNLIYVNESFAKMHGYTIDEILGVDISIFHTKEQMKNVDKLTEELKQEYSFIAEEVWHKRKDNTIFPVLINGTLIRDEKGEPLFMAATAIDITERKRAEDALRESEEKYRTLYESSLDGIIYTDMSGNILETNKSYLDMLGYSKEQVRKLTYQQVTPAKWYEMEADIVRNQIIARGYSDEYEKEYIRKDGTIFPISIRVWLIKDEKGKPQGMWGIVRDITERKKAQEEIKKSEIKYRSLVEKAGAGIVTIDSKGKLIFVNKALCEMIGYSQKELIDQAFVDLLYPDDKRRIMNMFLFSFKHPNRTLSLEFRAIHKDGHTVYMYSRPTPFIFKNKIVGFNAIISDLTELKRAEKALRESEASYRELADSITDIFFAMDKDLKYTYWNKASEILAGISAKDAIGKSLYEIFPQSKETIAEKMYLKALKTKQPQHFINKFKLTGKYYIFEIHAYPTQNGISVFVRDITERKQAEQELKNSREQLRSLTAHLQSIQEEERKRVAREIHDEFAQALTALKMDLSWVDKRIPKDKKSLFKKTRSMSKLIDKTIQTVKRISTDLRPGLLDDLGLTAAIEWQTEEFQKRTGIKCELLLNPENIILDQERSTSIFRIFQETLTNITRHAKASKVLISFKKKDSILELRVRDNGKGITKEKISDPKSFGFIGMQERAHFWGGRVKISSKPDKGTTVTATIPLPKKGEM